MLDRDTAVEAVRGFLQAVYPERAASVVMLPEKCVDHPYGWQIRFDFKEHIETGDWMQAPFTSVVIAPHDATAPHFPPTHLPVEEYLAQCVAGTWPPPA
jgi:hypothetical protein